jgi:hypothetical protein
MNGFLAALPSAGSSFGKITSLSASVILFIGIAIHFFQMHRQGLAIHHYLGILFFGVAISAVVLPNAGLWVTHLSQNSRGIFDILILGIAFLDVVMKIVSRFGGG